MRAAIYGAGAMGTVLGAYISRAGLPVQLVSRNKNHVAALNKYGARVVGCANFTAPVQAVTPEEMSGKYDLIFLMTKQCDNPSVLAFLKDFLAEDGAVCTLQNGLPEISVCEALGAERCLGCAVSWGATATGDGVSSLNSSADSLSFALGAPEGGGARLADAEKYLSAMGKVKTEKNFLGARWAKLAVNCAFSPISALTGLTFGEISRDKNLKAVALDLMNEAFAVARACGVKPAKIQGHDICAVYGCKSRGLKRALALALMPLSMKKHDKLVSGMYYDLAAGRKCEADFLNGLIVSRGGLKGVPVPVNGRILDMIHAAERGELPVSQKNIQKICKK